MDKITKRMTTAEIIRQLNAEKFIHGYIKTSKGERCGVFIAGYREADNTIFISSSRCRVSKDKFDEAQGLTIAINRYVKNVFGQNACDSEGHYPEDYTITEFSDLSSVRHMTKASWSGFEDVINNSSVYGRESKKFKSQLFEFFLRACRYYPTDNYISKRWASTNVNIQRVVFAMTVSPEDKAAKFWNE